jgi:peptide/nickel transport system substrate-binding protein
MLSDNTALLAINNAKKPLSDAKLRRAMAFAINSKMIVERVFEEMVMQSNPVGLLPVKSWMKYYDTSIEKEHGFSYDPQKAKELLDKAGYKDKNGDGMRETPDGKSIALSIIVPNGWTDWMESIKVIAKNLKEVGIECEPKFPDFNLYQTKRGNGDYDLMITNEGSSISVTPYTYFHFLYRDIIGDIANTGNFERYTNPEMKKLLNKLNRIPLDKEEQIKKVVTEISKLQLKDMPVIPLWYNGLWFQASSKHWENWPNEAKSYAYPCIWPNRWQFGAVEMLSQITPKK